MNVSLYAAQSQPSTSYVNTCHGGYAGFKHYTSWFQILWVHLHPERENALSKMTICVLLHYHTWNTWFPTCDLRGRSPSEISLKVHTNGIKTCGVKCPLSDSSPSQSCLCAWAQWGDGKGLPGCSVSYPPCHRYAAPVPGELGKKKTFIVVIGSKDTV